MKQYYNTLVRDKIPEIIENTGRRCEVRVLDNDDDIKRALIAKLREKAGTFAEKQTEDELSDLLSVVDAIVELYDFEPMHIDYIKMQNNEQKGSYTSRVFLESVTSDD